VPAARAESLQQWQFFTNVDVNGAPKWDTNPAGTQAVFKDGDPPPAGCIGEFSVSWVAPLKKWLLLYNCELPGLGTVRARIARAPWGPWSAPTEIFRADIDNAWCRYMHAESYTPCTDHLDGDNGPDGRAPGAPYAPFVLSRFTRATPHGAEIIFLMSTWNPYQVVIMKMNLTSSQQD
jgi:hypothetical protein